jgi:hypothetical protein
VIDLAWLPSATTGVIYTLERPPLPFAPADTTLVASDLAATYSALGCSSSPYYYRPRSTIVGTVDHRGRRDDQRGRSGVGHGHAVHVGSGGGDGHLD